MHKKITLLLTFLIVLSGCTSTLERRFIDSLARKFSNEESVVFNGEEDPELMGDSFPFLLKMLEVFLEASPENMELRQNTVQGYTVYANKWIEFEATVLEEDDLDKSEYLKYRAKRLYARARDYGITGFEDEYDDFLARLKQDKIDSLKTLTKSDVPLLTWTGVAWVAWLKLSAAEYVNAVADLPLPISMLTKAFELDPDYADGILHEVFISYYSNRLASGNGEEKKVAWHMDQLLKTTRGEKCSPYLTWATSVSISKQNKTEFQQMLQKAIDVDIYKVPKHRLSNALCNQQAKWYMTQTEDLFL